MAASMMGNNTNLSTSEMYAACMVASTVGGCLSSLGCCQDAMTILPAELASMDLSFCDSLSGLPPPPCPDDEDDGKGDEGSGGYNGYNGMGGESTTTSPYGYKECQDDMMPSCQEQADNITGVLAMMGMTNDTLHASFPDPSAYLTCLVAAMYESCMSAIGCCDSIEQKADCQDVLTGMPPTACSDGSGGSGGGGYNGGPGGGGSDDFGAECKGDSRTWSAGFGGCDTYGPGGVNDGWCMLDSDSSGVYAGEACPECGTCTAAPQTAQVFMAVACSWCRITAWTSSSLCLGEADSVLEECSNATLAAMGFAFTLEKVESDVCSSGKQCTIYTDEADFFPADAEQPCTTFALAQKNCTSETVEGAFFIRYGLAPLMLPVLAGTVPDELLASWSQWTMLIMSLRPYALAREASCFCDACDYAGTAADYMLSPANLMHLDLIAMEGYNGSYTENQQHVVLDAACPMLAAQGCFANHTACSGLSAALSFLGTDFETSFSIDDAACQGAGYPVDGSKHTVECGANYTTCRGMFQDYCGASDCSGGGGLCNANEILCFRIYATHYGPSGLGLTHLFCSPSSSGCACYDTEVQCTSDGLTYCAPTHIGCEGGPDDDDGSNSGGYGGGNNVYCEEQYCYLNVYANGEIDWDATYSQSPTCKTFDEGCPCNSQYEVECDSFGYKYCEQISVGCYDPFDITCAGSEIKCQDEYSSYCWDPAWGSCPLFCNSTETYCHSYGFDATGEYNYSDYQEFCAPSATGCPCNAQWEQKCTDQWGYSWCQSKSYSCPLTCADDEQDCYMTPFGSDGLPDWSLSHNQTCHPIDQSCPCHPTYEQQCHDNWGTWCQVLAWGSCPVQCTTDQIVCWVTPYNSDGTIDYSGTWTETCGNATEGCPCNPTWERQCTSYGYTYCESISNSCPVDCGNADTCYHYLSGNESCATSSGCVCEGDEISCANPDTGLAECYPAEWYPSGCPVFCAHNEMYCSVVSFDNSGNMQWQDYCLNGDANNWWCPVTCDNATSQKCGTPGAYDEHCVSLSDSCPVSCSEQYCWVDNYDTNGNWLDSSESCASWAEDCPCGNNAVKCTDPFFGYSYCTATSWGCPLVCDPVNEKTCYPVAYTLEGEQDWNAPVNESCQNVTQTCPCGANAKMCRWTDEWGYDNEVCYPTAETCPVSCKSTEQRCYILDYATNGFPGAFRETCVSATAVCPCGTNAQQCHDPHW
ncbi:unnamed protein product, partial [Symbiodinium natans]